MSLPTINITPLFQTSLRSWQASWKASQTQAGQQETSPEIGRPSAKAAPRSQRLGRLLRRPRRPQHNAPSA
jgi:hypothetical protein